jgi:hypothetical protein
MGTLALSPRFIRLAPTNFIETRIAIPSRGVRLRPLYGFHHEFDLTITIHDNLHTNEIPTGLRRVPAAPLPPMVFG